jgi:hypothetical protein
VRSEHQAVQIAHILRAILPSSLESVMENWRLEASYTDYPITPDKTGYSGSIAHPVPRSISRAVNSERVDRSVQPTDTIMNSRALDSHKITNKWNIASTGGLRVLAGLLAALSMPLSVASQTTTEPPAQMNLATLADLVELAATIVPQRASDLKWRLRVANCFIPMPLSLGWWTVSGRVVVSPDTVMSGLCITDMASGATRDVTAGWIHCLYQHTLDSLPLQRPNEGLIPGGAIQNLLPRGTTLLRLKEVGYHAKFGWPHLIIIGAVLLQFVLALYLILSNQQRPGWLMLAGILIRTLHCAYDWKYPVWHPPRSVKKGRFYAVHTRMTTRHLLILVHEPETQKDACISIEDAAAPVLRARNGRNAWVEHICEQTLRLAAWSQQAASVLIPSSGFILSIVLLVGTSVQEIVSFFNDATPHYSRREDMETHESLLDMLTAACQAVDLVSVGLVESVLPDPTGEHMDYAWISSILKGDAAQVEPHRKHASKDEVLSYVRRRRNVKV